MKNYLDFFLYNVVRKILEFYSFILSDFCKKRNENEYRMYLILNTSRLNTKTDWNPTTWWKSKLFLLFRLVYLTENAWHSVKHFFGVSTIFHTVIVFLPLSNDIGGSAYQAPDTHAYIVKRCLVCTHRGK